MRDKSSKSPNQHKTVEAHLPALVSFRRACILIKHGAHAIHMNLNGLSMQKQHFIVAMNYWIHQRAKVAVLMISLTAVTPVVATGLSAVQQRALQEEATHILGGNASVISRWHGPVRPRVVGTVAPGTIHVINQTFSDISDITGLTLESAASPVQTLEEYRHEVATHQSPVTCARPDCANFIVVLTGVDEMRELAPLIPLRPLYLQSLQPPSDPLCFFSPLQNPMMQIVQSLVYVRQDLPQKMKHTCIREEIYQSFGMFSDATDSAFFSFDNRETPKTITYYDQQLLRAIYDPTLNPGAPVFQVVRLFMREFGGLK